MAAPTRNSGTRPTGAQARWQGHELKPVWGAAHHAEHPSSQSFFVLLPHDDCAEGEPSRPGTLEKRFLSFLFTAPSGFPHNRLACQPSLFPDHQCLRAQLTNPRHRIPYPSPLSVEIGVGTDRNLVKGETHQMTLKNEPIAP